MQTWLDRCEWALTLVAALATVVMMLLTTADACGRYLFNRPILAAYELTTNYLMIAAIFLAMPYTYRQGGNIRVTFVVERFGVGARMVVNHVVHVVAILYSAALVVATGRQMIHVWRTHTTFVTLELPLWPAHLLVFLGLLLTAVLMLIDLWRVRSGTSGLFRDG
jgi:TRAP-type C4-dicarboxylate transport system permease small subunit